MTTLDAYRTFIVKMNESATSRGMAVNKGKFVVLFNRNYLKVIEKYLNDKTSDEIDKIRGLLVTDQELLFNISDENSYSFKLPKTYLEYDNIRARAKTKEGCSDYITLFPIKGRDTGQILSDEYNKPSFFAREAPYRVVSDGIKIYIDNFTIDKVSLDYYRQPIEVSTTDDYNPESDIIERTFEVADTVIEQAITMTVVEYTLSNEEFNRAQYEAQNL